MEGEGLPIALVGFERTMQDVRLVVLAAAGGFGYLPGISPTPESAPPSASLASRRRNFGPILVFGSVRGRDAPCPSTHEDGAAAAAAKGCEEPSYHRHSRIHTHSQSADLCAWLAIVGLNLTMR